MMRVTIIGSGLMGKGLVQVFAQCPEVSLVSWLGRSLDKLADGFKDLEITWQKLITKGKIAENDFKVFSSKIQWTTEMDCVDSSELVIEAVKECIATKKTLFGEVSKHLMENALIASNSSSLSITELASNIRKPENAIGMHFFNPPGIMKLVEIVVGIRTSEQTIHRAQEIAKLLGKDSIVVKEAPGFIVNRMLIPMINEAIGLLAEGFAEAMEIDKAMTLGANHPIGPLALADLIGNDVVLAIMETLKAESGDPKYRPHPLLRKMVRAKLLGRKTKQGFFSYAEVK